MNKTHISLASVLLALTSSGCTVPGSYINPSDFHLPQVKSDIKNGSLQQQLLHPKLVALEDISNNAELLKYVSKPYEYRVGAGDVLGMMIWGHPEISVGSQATTAAIQEVSIAIDANGSAVFPLIGKVQVADLTITEIRDHLTTRFAQYIRQPQLNLHVTAFNSQRAHVIGEVMQPGVRSISDKPLTVLDAINLSGGINVVSADARYVYIIRNQDDCVKVYWLRIRTPQALVAAGKFNLINNDIVYVAAAGIANWNRVVSQILPTVQTIWYTQAMLRR